MIVRRLRKGAAAPHFRSIVEEVSGILPAEEFRVVLERECACVNRNNHKFSLIVFDIEDRSKPGVPGLTQAAALISRVGRPYTTGLLDTHRIGVALPYSDIDEVKELAEKMLRELSIMPMPVQCNIYTYPSVPLGSTGPSSGPSQRLEMISGGNAPGPDGIPTRTPGDGNNGSAYRAIGGAPSPRRPLALRTVCSRKQNENAHGTFPCFAPSSPLLSLVSAVTGILWIVPRLLRRKKAASPNCPECAVDVPGALCPEEFAAVIERERTSVEVNCHEFSLIVIDTKKARVNIASALRLALNRVRCTDEVGLLDEHHIGIALSYTGENGARKLAEEIVQALTRGKSSPRFTLYTYPDDRLPESGRSSEQSGSGRNISPERAASLAAQPLSTGPAAGEENATASSSIHRTIFSKPIKRLVPLISRRNPSWKRSMDIMGSLFALILLSPLFLLAYLIIKAVSPGPMLFRQKRVGYLGKTFDLLKFRTMSLNADTSAHKELVKQLIKENGNNGNAKPMTKLHHDSRIIPLGVFLRKTCIDELPQLINVLRGEMSLVGPRPCLPYEALEYRLWNTQRFGTVPGMTGLWQVNGKNRLTFEQMVRLDINYTRKRSFWLDMRILVMTLPAIVTQFK